MLQWWQIGGGPGELPLRSGVGISDGRVLLIFIAAVVSLLLVTLPFASERPIPIDHPLAYTILLVVMLIGYVLVDCSICLTIRSCRGRLSRASAPGSSPSVSGCSRAECSRSSKKAAGGSISSKAGTGLLRSALLLYS
jgi:hypothetical protein